jgi:hypothetical protein
MRFAANPWFHIGWCLVVIMALVTTYRVDPYVFGFTALGAMWLTPVVVVVALIAVIRSKSLRSIGRIAIVASAMITAAAIAYALDRLQDFNWP